MPRKPAPNSSSSVPAEPALVVTSQQSRFHTASEASESFTTKDLDIQTLNIAIGNKEILVDATLKLQYGVRYALVGRNGVGKSTLLKAIGEKLIPDIPANLKILLLGQTETLEDTRVGETVVEYVVRSDKEREKAMRESECALQFSTSHLGDHSLMKLCSIDYSTRVIGSIGGMSSDAESEVSAPTRRAGR